MQSSSVVNVHIPGRSMYYVNVHIFMVGHDMPAYHYQINDNGYK